MKILVSGSVAFDYLLQFQGNFKDSIKAEDLDSLSAAFLTPHLNKQLGGCSGNIAYNLKQLGLNPFPVASVGHDIKPYKKWLKKINMPRDFLLKLKDCYTAQAFIISDSFNHQITAFHPGAMADAEKSVLDAEKIKKQNFAIAIVAPNSLNAMIKQADELHKANVPFIFDPGQGLGMFNKSQLEVMVKKANWLIVNYFESKMLLEKMELNENQLAKELDALIITNADKGSQIYANSEILNITAVGVNQAIDPTGCGDAYRAGLIYGILNKLTWKQIGQLSNVIGAIKVQSSGTQNHKLTFEGLEKIYQSAYKQTIKLN